MNVAQMVLINYSIDEERRNWDDKFALCLTE